MHISRCGICAYSYAINRRGKDQAGMARGDLIDDSDGETDAASLCSAVGHSGTALKWKVVNVLACSAPLKR